MPFADFQALYKQKLTTADEAVKIIKSGDWVDYGFCAIHPRVLDEALARRAPELTYAPPKYNPLLGGALYLMAEQQGVDLADGRLAARLAHGLAQAQKARL